MQSDPTARLKLLSVLKVSNTASPPPAEEKKDEPQRTIAVQQLKQVLFKGPTQAVPSPSPPPQLNARSSPPQPLIHNIPPNWKEMGPPGLTSPLKPPALIPTQPEVREMPSLIPNPKRMPNPTAIPEPTVPAPVPADKNDTKEVEEATPAATGTPGPPRRRLFFIRTAATSKGQIELLWRGQTASKDMVLSDGFKLRPGASLTCEWKLPLDLFTDKPDNNEEESSPEPKLMIGLYRFGCHSNKEGSIISKDLMEESQEIRDDSEVITTSTASFTATAAPGLVKSTTSTAITSTTTATTIRYRHGKMKFFAPKSAGVYLFRIYDANASDGAFESLAISCKIVIVLMDRDIARNLKFVLKAFSEESKLKGIGLFNLILPHIKNRNDQPGGGNNNYHNNNSGMSSSVDLKEMIQDINTCVEEVLYAVNDTMDLIDEGQLRKAMNALTLKANEAIAEATADNEELGNDDPTNLDNPTTTAVTSSAVKKPRAGSITEEAADGDQEFWKRYRTAMKVHLEAYETLVTLVRNKTPWYWIFEALKTRVKHGISLFCPILRRFFPSVEAMQTARRKVLEFTPPFFLNAIVEGDKPSSRYPPQQTPSSSSSSSSSTVVQQVSKALFDFIHPLMVTPQFEQERLALCQNLEEGLRLQGFIPQVSLLPPSSSSVAGQPATLLPPPPPALSLPTPFRLALYGSSRNGFGAPGSDIDICLALTHPCHDAICKLKIMCDLEEKLQQLGMKEVKALLTARVPIVEFVDPTSESNIDISFQNDLAVSNTEMLRVYSVIDPRVRQLVYAVKHWAKVRQINSPQQGTLGSYGYVLTVIHFLQQRPVPILPCLQSLSGESLSGPTTASTGRPLYHPNSNNSNSSRYPAGPVGLEKMMINPIDQTRCNLYYLQPTPEQLQLLQSQAQQNKESLSELLLEYFKYFAYQFDLRNQVVSIRDRKPVFKVDKYEYFCWPHTDLLAIEDPFEIHYDVAHVLRTGKMVTIRKEYLRAYTILSRCLQPQQQLGNQTSRNAKNRVEAGEAAEKGVEMIPQQITASQVMELLFEPVVVDVPVVSSDNNNNDNTK